MNADEMFEKLGYKCVSGNSKYSCNYRNKRGSHIYFVNEYKTIDLASRYDCNKILTLSQLKAINKKVKELKWI